MTPRLWGPIVRLLVSVALLALVVSRLDLARASEILSSSRVELIVLAVAVGFIGRFFAAFRWFILLRAMGSGVPYRRVLRLSFIGMFLQFLPAGSVASEGARIYGLSRSTSDLAGSFTSVFVDRMFGLGALIVVALVGLAFAPPGVPPMLSELAWIGFVLIIAVGFGVMNPNARRVLRVLLVRIRLGPVQQRLQKVYIRLDEMRSSPDLMGWSAVTALVNTGFRIVPAWFVALALAVDVSLSQLFIMIPLIYLAAQIPISIGGLGVREVGWVALLRVIDVPSSAAIVMALLLAAKIFIVSLPGAWLYVRHGLDAPHSSPEDGNASAGIAGRPVSDA